MRAGVYKGGQTVAVEELPDPTAGDGEIVIDVSHCGICGSDLHFVIEGWGAPGAVHGHEYSGVVAAVGPGVSGWSVGDRVIGGPSRGCGSCPACQRGTPNLCARRGRAGIDHSMGAFAERKALRAEAAYPVPPDLDLRVAALSEPVAVALRGARRSGAAAGSRVLVTGAGPIGVLTVAVLRTMGVTDVVVSEPNPLRRALAMDLGATAVEPDSLTQPELPMDVLDEPFDAVIECSGRPEAFSAGLASLRRGGTLVLSGTGMRHPRLDTNRVILNELVVTGTVEYTPDDFSDAIDLLHALPTDVLIEPEDVGLGDIGEAMAALADGRIAGKVLVDPNA